MAYTQLKPRFTPSARVDEITSGHYRLTIPSGKADNYRLAQLDDYALLSRRQFPHHFLQDPSLPSSTRPIGQSEQRLRTSLSLLARTSSDSLPGTWGFGLWNDPFGVSLGLGGRPFRLPALPNAVWFFGASEENYLSFKSFPPERSEERSSPALAPGASVRRTQSKSGVARGGLDASEKIARSTRPAVNGFLAQSFRSPRFHPLLFLAGIMLPISRKATRRLLSKVIAEDGIELSRGDAYPIGHTCVAPTDWHRYRLEWSPKRVVWEVDEVQLFESAVSPNPPLGLVIWIDNQYAAFTPEGRIGFGVLENPEPVWLEIKDIEMSP